MRKAISIVLIIAFVAFTGYKIAGKIRQAQALEKEAQQRQNQPLSTVPVVKVVELTLRPIEEILSLAGEIRAEAEIAVQPRINGRLISLVLAKGQIVRAGQLIAILDDETVRLQIEQSEAAMAIVQANLRQAQLTAARAQADLERYKELLAKRFISQQQYDIAEASYMNALASVEGLQAQLASARKNHEILQVQLGHTKVYSPAMGFVIDAPVSAGMNLTTGTTIATLAALDPVRLSFNIDQRDTSKISRGMQVRFTCDAFPDRTFAGVIDEIAPAYDPKTRTLSLSAKLNNPGGRLLPGIFGTAAILIGGKEKALVVPREAVIAPGGRTSGVFVVDRRKRAKFVPVTTGLSSEGLVEITGGLRPGDLVVVIGQNRLRDGQQVEIMGSNGRPGDEKPRTSGANPATRKAGEGR
ncbi:MAG: efflux RND transporter periplasmic adaptor subunit [Patescibacteria group bacterium]